jgi:beta-aspartyl-peptidase (threonine type)
VLVVGSEHALGALEAAWQLLAEGADALDAVVAATRLVEDDLAVHSVGTGGYPNLTGTVELDASVMEGTNRRAGAVAALSGFTHPVSVAREVMERLPHLLLVGDGAACFATEIGAERGELLTAEAEAHWRDGVARARASAGDGLLDQARALTADPSGSGGTVDVLALDGRGHIASAVSTSGWAFKWPGRVGDSPLPGAGNYCDDRYGAAGCTGFGELAIRAGTARAVVDALARGATPQRAGIEALEDVWRLVSPGAGAVMDVVVLDRHGRHCGLSTERGRHYVWRDAGVGGPVLAERVVVGRAGGQLRCPPSAGGGTLPGA